VLYSGEILHKIVGVLGVWGILGAFAGFIGILRDSTKEKIQGAIRL
jgi:hypothetical protein